MTKHVKHLIAVFAIFSLMSFTLSAADCEKIRAAFDVGSGATKMKVASVNTCTNEINKILLDTKEAVAYSDDLAAGIPLGRLGFSTKIMEKGIAAIQRLKDKAAAYSPDEYRAVATAAFRQADNAKSYLSNVYEDTGVSVHIISQDSEAQLGFISAVYTLRADPKHLISWDIGGGSMQISMQADDGFHTDLGTMASSTFKNKVLQEVVKVDPLMVSTPNPMSLEQIEAARKLAQIAAAKVSRVMRAKIKAEQGNVVGIGSLHTQGVQARVNSLVQYYTRDELEAAVQKLAGKNDAELGGGPYAASAVTDLILVLGIS